MVPPIMASMGFICMVFALLLLVPCRLDAQNNKNRKSLIIRVDDVKEFKKLLRTKTNLLVICTQSEKATAKVSHIFEDVAEEMKGKATLAYINCGDDKKVCKQLKFAPTSFDLRHYKDGEYNKDYDRKLAVKSMVNFLLDPTGDLPWEEDPLALDVVHISTEDGFTKLLKKEKNPLLVMFYAPWCGFCKRLKPDFAAAASEVKNEATLVGIDVDKPHMMHLRMEYNITGFPTIYYFVKGQVQFKYGGENTKAGIISWLQNPQEVKEKEKEAEWADEESNVVHLTDETFHDFVKQNPSVLVMFYAPWCGHCKHMKPGYTEAAQFLKDEGITGVLAAVDATKEKKLAQEQNIKGFPTVKYFRDGEFAFEVNQRDKDQIIEFMKDPKEPPPPPPAEVKWEEIESDVTHLTDDTFKQFLKKKKHCLVMFYAPWCGHCKKAKPEYMAAAAVFKEDPKVAFAAVDCTVQTGTCNSHDVKGYPTFKYFNYGKNSQKYMGGREENDFIAFMKDPQNPAATPTGVQTESLEDQWKPFTGYQSLQFLTASNFDATIADNVQTLVMFYAPWCGHCKKMKPEFSEASEIVKKEGLGILGVVDATIEKDLADRFNIKGFPTKYRKIINDRMQSDGKEVEYTSGRTKQEIVHYMIQSLYGEEATAATNKDGSSPFMNSKLVHLLNLKNFKEFLSEQTSAFIMFYKPDSSLSQIAKPHFFKAAKTVNAPFAAVDCIKDKALCANENITVWPTLSLYVNGQFHKQYNQPPHFTSITNFVQADLIEGSKEASQSAKKSKNDREDL